MEEVLSRVPDALHASISTLWNSPPADAGEDGRRLLFFPETLDDGATYARWLLDDNSNALSRVALALLFVLHGDQRSVQRGFVCNGGLSALSALVDNEDLHSRAHAVELLSLISSDDRWYGNDDESMQRSLLKLADTPKFVENLLKNREYSYPGGEISCLRLLASWLSWLRHEHTEDRRLGVSRFLLQGLGEWAKAARGRGDAEEEELATRLFDDFSRMPTFSDDEDSDRRHVRGYAFKCRESSVVEIGPDGSFELVEAESAEQVEPPKAMSRRDRANHHFATGDLEAALSEYALALNETSDPTQKASLHANRAICFFKQNRSAECESECRIALLLDPSNAKARYRLVHCLSFQPQRIWEAIDVAQDAPRKNAQISKLLIDLYQSASEVPAETKRQRRQAQLIKQLVRSPEHHEMISSSQSSSSTKTFSSSAKPISTTKTVSIAEIATNVDSRELEPPPAATLTQRDQARDDDQEADSDDDIVVIATKKKMEKLLNGQPADQRRIAKKERTPNVKTKKKKKKSTEDQVNRALAQCFA